MHKQAKQPGDLGDLINGWVCSVGLIGYLAWHFAKWVGA